MTDIGREFHTLAKAEMKKIENEYKSYGGNLALQKALTKKHPFLKRKSPLPFLDELLNWPVIKERFGTRMATLKEVLICKITGIFKHGQTDKTALCNLRILSNVRLGILSIAISKNTLHAKSQWESRLIKSLKEQNPGTPLKELILIISSKKNDLSGNATHCKNVDEAIANYTRGNFKVIFICSNNTRFKDVLTFLESYDGFATEKRLQVDVQQDEAHNQTEGIPSKRELAEHIIMNPYVKSYVPISASNHPIAKEDSTLWKLENLENYAINYSQHSTTTSTSPNYSSISDAVQVPFEDFQGHSSYTDHNITEFDEKTFDEADLPGYYAKWTNAEAIKEDKKRRMQLEFCEFMGLERIACNMGMNILDNYLRLSVDCSDGKKYEDDLIILPGILNFHLMTTPCRVAATIHLMKYAVKQPYKPICIGMYRGGIHVRYVDKYGRHVHKPSGEISAGAGTEEVNEKIYAILEELKTSGESIDRPVIIMGNYKPTGESITFVNYKYGTLRSNILLPAVGQTREANYQGFLRCCYMTTKFVEKNPKFTIPIKFIIGTAESIQDAISYEKENDERIQRLCSENQSGEINVPIMPNLTNTAPGDDDDTTISVPCKITITDVEAAEYIQVRAILKKGRRTEEDKKRLLALLWSMQEAGAADIADPTGKLKDIKDRLTIRDIRCWKAHAQEGERAEGAAPAESTYRFSEYNNNHIIRRPYINNRSKMGTYDCDFLAAYDRYQWEGFVNQKAVMWLSYRFPAA
jgi:hypothetical protein